MTKHILFPSSSEPERHNATTDTPLYGAIREKLQQHILQRALTDNFVLYYYGGRALGHLSAISAGALLAGTKGAAMAGVVEMLIHVRRSPYNTEFGVNQTMTHHIDRHWQALAETPVTQRLNQTMREALVAATAARRHKHQVSQTTAIPGLSTRLTALPAGVRGCFIRAAIVLGARHTAITPIHRLAKRAISAMHPLIHAPRQTPRP